MLEFLAYKNRHIAIVTIALITFMASPSYANNCEFTSLPFGISQTQLKDTFSIDALEVATKGEGIIRIGAHEICKDLPERSMAELMFIDNTFVQLSIEGENASAEILKFAHKIFGEQDNTKREKIVTHALWKEENHYSVIYSAYTEGRYDLEKLVITSSQHDKLFEKQNTIDDQNAVEDEKNN